MGKAQQLVFSKNGVKTVLDLTNPTITYQTIQTNSHRQLGEIVESATPLEDSNLEILDGQYVSAMEHTLFFNYLETLKRTNPEKFCHYGEFESAVEETGECHKFGIDPENLTDKPQDIRLPKYKQGDILYYICVDVKSNVSKPIVEAEVHDSYEIDPDLGTDFYLTLMSKNCDFTIKQPSKPDRKYVLHFWMYQKQDNSTCHFPQNVRGPQNNQISLQISKNYVTHFTLTTITGGAVWMYNYDNYWFAPVVSGLKSPRYKVTVVFEFVELNRNTITGQSLCIPCMSDFQIYDDYVNELIKFPGPEYMPDGRYYGHYRNGTGVGARSYAILSTKETSNHLYYTKNDFDAFPMKPHHIKCYFYTKDCVPENACFGYSRDDPNYENPVNKNIYYGHNNNWLGGAYASGLYNIENDKYITTGYDNLSQKALSPFRILRVPYNSADTYENLRGQLGTCYFPNVLSYNSQQSGHVRADRTQQKDGTKIEFTFYTNHPITRFSVYEGDRMSYAYGTGAWGDSFVKKMRVSMYWDDQLKKTQIYDRTARGTINFALDDADRIEDVQYTPEVELPQTRNSDLEILENTMEYNKNYNLKVTGLVGESYINVTSPIEMDFKANLLGEAEIEIPKITDFQKTTVDLEFTYKADREHTGNYSKTIDLYTPNVITLEHEKLSSGNHKFTVNGGVKDVEIKWVYPENPNFDTDGITAVVQKDTTYDADGKGVLILDPETIGDDFNVSVKFAGQEPQVSTLVVQPETPSETEGDDGE